MLERTVCGLTGLLLGLLVLGPPTTSTYAQVEVEPSHEFELEEVLSIGDDEEAPREYLFSNPEHIRTDADGRIYVAEGVGIGTPPGRRVRVFSPDGEFLGALGRHGGGPGEFKFILAIALDAKNRLVVYDRRLDRFTRYPPFETIESFPRPDPDRIETVQNPQDSRFTPASMHGLPNGQFVSYHPPLQNPISADQPRLHIYDESFEKVGAFGPLNDRILPNGKLGRELAQSSLPHIGGIHVAPGTSSLLLSPLGYRGILYRYVREENGTWTLQRLEGRNPEHPTYDVVPCNKGGEINKQISSSIGEVCLQYRSVSRGIGQLNNGRIVHLSTSEDEDGIRQLQLELFSPDGTLQKVGRIEGFVHDKTEFKAIQQAVLVKLLWVDRRNRLYLEDHRSGFPVIRVMKLEE